MTDRIRKAILKWLVGSTGGHSPAEMFNSMRINALTQELSDKGCIDESSYENRLKTLINERG